MEEPEDFLFPDLGYDILNNEENILGDVSNLQETQDKIKTAKNLIKRGFYNEDTNDNIKNQYIYRDANNIPQYRIVEQNIGQKFIVQSYNNGSYEYKMNGKQRIPYLLPQIINNPQRVVFIVNGEDKADFVTSLGFVATTAPFGDTYKWKEEYNKYLENSKGVLIIEDKKSNPENTKYVKNTFFTLKKNIANIGVVSIDSLATEEKINLEGDTTILQFGKIVGNQKTAEILQKLEDEM